MDHDHEPGAETPDGTPEPVPPNARIDYFSAADRERERHRHEGAGASRDLTATLLEGGY